MTREEAIKYIKSRCIGSTEERDGTQWSEAMWTAIEALAERPTVDKEYLIDLIQEAVYDGETCAKLIDLVDRPTGWIPVSERLPDIGDTFLVTVMVGKEIRTDVADSFGSYIDGFWDTFNDWIEDEECHVIAWMPLPPGYQGE